MFDTSQGPVQALSRFYDWVVDHAALLDEPIKEKMRHLNRLEEGARAHIEVVECLYRACSEDEDLPGRAEALSIMGTLAMHTYQINLWGRAKRHYQIAAWAAGQLDDEAGGATGPELDPEFVFARPIPVEMPAPGPMPVPAPEPMPVAAPQPA